MEKETLAQSSELLHHLDVYDSDLFFSFLTLICVQVINTKKKMKKKKYVNSGTVSHRESVFFNVSGCYFMSLLLFISV